MLSLLPLLSILCSILLIDGQTIVNRTFIQSATTVGSSSVCEGSSQTFNCTIEVFISGGVGFLITNAIWERDDMVISDNTPRHTLLRTQHGLQPVVTGLMVDSTALDDDGAVYSCTADNASDDFTSDVTLNVAEIPPVENLIVSDQCINITANWDITEGSCTHLSYNVTLSSSDGVILQGPLTTNYTYYIFNDTEIYNGTFIVSVIPINGNVRGDNFSEPSVIGVSPDGDTNIRNVSEICVRSFNISWDAPSITCGDVSYEVSVSQLTNEGNGLEEEVLNVSELVDRSLSLPELDNSRPVMITVTATDRVGPRNGSVFSPQLRESEKTDFICQDSPQECNLMPTLTTTCDNVRESDVTLSWKRPMINPCTTLPIAGYHINVSRSVCMSDDLPRSYTSNFINDTLGNMGTFSMSYTEVFGDSLKPNFTYMFTVIPTNNPVLDVQSVRTDNGTTLQYDYTFICSMNPNSTAPYCEVNVTNGDTMGGQAPVKNNMASVMINELRCDTTYKVRARALLVDGTQLRSDFIANDLHTDRCPQMKDDDNDTTEIIVIIVIGVCVFAWICCMAALYCNEEKMEDGSSDKADEGCGLCVLILFSCGTTILIRNCCPTSSKCRRIFFLISSLGLGYVVWTIYTMCGQERNKGSVQQGIEMGEKSSDLYDSPGLKKDTIADKGESQALYSYARTGPVNVVIPGSANS